MQAENTDLVFALVEESSYRTAMTTNLKKARIAAGLSQDALASLAATSQPQVMRLENGERELTVTWARKFAPFLNVTVEHLLELDTLVSIVGYVGAGGHAEFVEGATLGHAPRPPGFGLNGVALQVRGDSMPGVAEDDWLIYYDERFEAPSEDMIGQLCVVQIEDGPVLVKRIYHGGEEGKFDLVSSASSYEPIRNAQVQWIAKVEWIKPR